MCLVGFSNTANSYRMWFEDGYWINYNFLEALAWLAKAAVILPRLIWQKKIWERHIVTLRIGLSSVLIVRNLV